VIALLVRETDEADVSFGLHRSVDMRFVWVSDRVPPQVINMRTLWCLTEDGLPSRYIFPTALLWL
jgi:hypothetical protein